MKSLSVFLTLVLLLIIFAENASAKVTIGGRIYVDCYYLDRNTENAQYYKLGDGTFTNTAIQVPNITRLNVNWTNEDNVGMFIQVGVGQTEGGTDSALDKTTGKMINDVNSNGVDLRHAYGWWDLTDNFQFLAGKTTTPVSPLLPYQMLGTRSGSLNVIGEGYGEFYSGRFAQIRGTYYFTNTVRLAIALVDPNGAALGNYAPYGDPNSYQTDTKLPRIDVGLPIYAGPVSIYPSFLYQRRTVDFLSDMDGVDNRIDTYIGSLGVLASFGPFQVSAEGNWGQNWSNTGCGIGVSPPARNSAATLYKGQLDDTTTYGWWVDGSYRVGIVTPHILYGQMKSEGDKNPMRYKSWFWGISIPIAVTSGFSVVPEFMWYDDGDDNQDQWDSRVDNGRYAIYGVQFQFRF